VVIVIDEAHELFCDDKEAASDAERLIKRGRALGLIVVLATQIPDRSSRCRRTSPAASPSAGAWPSRTTWPTT
jgi:hypothetical protein